MSKQNNYQHIPSNNRNIIVIVNNNETQCIVGRPSFLL
jgi:hypothetical protein